MRELGIKRMESSISMVGEILWGGLLSTICILMEATAVLPRESRHRPSDGAESLLPNMPELRRQCEI